MTVVTMTEGTTTVAHATTIVDTMIVGTTTAVMTRVDPLPTGE